jgi:hypothetical protein
MVSDDHKSQTLIEYPAIADIDADGGAESVVSSSMTWGCCTLRLPLASAGSHGLSVVVDPEDQVAECDEANNTTGWTR